MMKNKAKILTKGLGTTIALITTVYVPLFVGDVIAAIPEGEDGSGGGTEDCGIWFNDSNPDSAQHVLGTKLDCIAGNLFHIVAQITIGLAILFTLFTIFKTVTSQDNAKKMEEVAVKWKYTIGLIILAGVGGTLINIALKFLGFPIFSDMWNATWQPLITFLNG